MTTERSSNISLLEQLRFGIAQFEIVSSPLPSISATCQVPFPAGNSHRFFARIGSSQGSPAMRKVEHFSVQKVTGDGRCLFRALVLIYFLLSAYKRNSVILNNNEVKMMKFLVLNQTLFLTQVKGMAFNKGISLNPREERDDADELRMAVKEVICDSNNKRYQFEAALIAITVDESLKRYCERIGRPDFWGGESELLVLSKLCNQPIIVYIPEHEHTRGGWGSGFIPIAEYGAEFRKGSRRLLKPRKVVRLLYSGKNHYDLLV